MITSSTLIGVKRVPDDPTDYKRLYEEEVAKYEFVINLLGDEGKIAKTAGIVKIAYDHLSCMDAGCTAVSSVIGFIEGSDINAKVLRDISRTKKDSECPTCHYSAIGWLRDRLKGTKGSAPDFPKHIKEWLLAR